GAERDTGDDAGERDRQDEKQRDRFAPEETRPGQGRGGERPEDQGDDGGEGGDSERKAERIEDILPAPSDTEPLQRKAGRRKLIAAVLAGEGVKDDEGERDVDESEPGAGREFQADRGALSHGAAPGIEWTRRCGGNPHPRSGGG